MSQSKQKWTLNRRSGRGRNTGGEETGNEPLFVYGLHTVAAALANPRRIKLALKGTANGLARLAEAGPIGDVPTETLSTRELGALLPGDAVHQGVALEVEPLAARPLEDLGDARLIVALDQVTDPHNVGAVMRTAVAFGADAFITMWRHSPRESGVLAKAASGAVDYLDHIHVRNLTRTLEELRGRGFQAIGLDSEGATPFSAIEVAEKVVLVLGAEGKGLRQGVREACDVIARLELTGPIASLNVSNAAAIALYAVAGARASASSADGA